MTLEEGYIGITVNTSNRFSQHLRDSRNERRYARNKHLYSALNKYDDIEFEIIEEGSEEYIMKREFELRPRPFMGWNQAVGGGSQGGNIYLGRKRPEHAEAMKLKGFQSGNEEGSLHPIMVAGFIFKNKREASKILGINAKTIYNRCRRGMHGYQTLRDEANDLV